MSLLNKIFGSKSKKKDKEKVQKEAPVKKTGRVDQELKGRYKGVFQTGEGTLSHEEHVSYSADICRDTFIEASKEFFDSQELHEESLLHLSTLYTSQVKYFRKNDAVEQAVQYCIRRFFERREQEGVLSERDRENLQIFKIATPAVKINLTQAEISKFIENSAHIRESAGTPQVLQTPQVQQTIPQTTVTTPVDDNAPVANVYLNVDTNKSDDMTKGIDRSTIGAEVGHTWLTIQPLNGILPADLANTIAAMSDTARNSMRIMEAKGETAVGFWPLFNRFEEIKKKDKQKKIDKKYVRNLDHRVRLDICKEKGFTAGSGTVDNDVDAHGFNFVTNCKGRVEEPDDEHTPKGRKKFTLNRKQLLTAYQYIDSHRSHFYNLESYNCTTFAVHTLQHAGFSAKGSRANVCYPAKLYRELYNEAKKDIKAHRESDVQLLKLEANESHGECRKGKKGEAGNALMRQVTVDKFDMVTKYVDHAEETLRSYTQADDKYKDLYKKRFMYAMCEDESKRTTAEKKELIQSAQNAGMFNDLEGRASSKIVNALVTGDETFDLLDIREMRTVNIKDDSLLEYIAYQIPTNGLRGDKWVNVMIKNFAAFSPVLLDKLIKYHRCADSSKEVIKKFIRKYNDHRAELNDFIVSMNKTMNDNFTMAINECKEDGSIKKQEYDSIMSIIG